MPKGLPEGEHNSHLDTGHIMSTHQQLLYHVVFSTKNRKRYLRDGFRESVFQYMAGTCKGLGGFALRVDGFYDHVHVFVRIPARIAVATFVGKLKASTSKHINDADGQLSKFGWQDGYGAFTVSLSQKESVYQYIARQMEHHRKRTFQEEYIALLDRHGIEYDKRFVFD